jgi:Flp pilus assembly pilin Flp
MRSAPPFFRAARERGAWMLEVAVLYVPVAIALLAMAVTAAASAVRTCFRCARIRLTIRREMKDFNQKALNVLEAHSGQHGNDHPTTDNDRDTA